MQKFRRPYVRDMSLQTTLGVAKTGTRSLRATVPEGVVAYLGLEPGNKLEWRMEIEEGRKVVLVRKSNSLDSDTTKIASKYAKVKSRK